MPLCQSISRSLARTPVSRRSGVPVVGLQVHGLNELRRAFKDADASELPAALKQANQAAAELVVDVATPMTPRRFGDLAHSLRALATQSAGKVRAGNTAVPYAAAIHWGRKVGNVGRPPGNRKGRNPIKGRPFIWDAAKTSERQIAYEYDRAIDEIVLGALRTVKGD